MLLGGGASRDAHGLQQNEGRVHELVVQLDVRPPHAGERGHAPRLVGAPERRRPARRPARRAP
eukprot:7179475-Alexandrium_andersonii.AAC.1